MATKKLQILDSLIKQAENANTLDGKHASDFLNTITLTTVFDENFNVLVTTDATTIPKDFATDYKDNAKYVFVPYSVTQVEAGAFYYCTNISDVFIDNIRGGILFMSLENVDTNSSISAFPASTNLHYVKGSNTLQGLLSQINAKSDKFTTLSGYGITDAYTKTEVDDELAAKADLVQSKNIFDFDTWAKGLQNLKKPIYNGTLDVVDFDEKSITFTSTGSSTFTNGWVDEPAEMRIAVKSNTVYTFSWLFENSTNNRIFLFFNGQNTAETRLTEVGSKAFLTFTTPEDASYITIRFDSYNQNIAAKVSNIMIGEGDKKSLYLPYEVAEGVKELAQSTESAITEVDTALSGKLDNTTGSVATDNIANKAVTNEKIANGAITALKLANGAVSGSNIAQNQISTDHLQSEAVTNDKIANGAISEPKLESKLLSKLSYVTPQMYGAVGDGVTDDTDAIQSAMNYVTANGGSLHFPGSTTYIISKPIQIITDQKSFEIDFGYSTITCGSEFNSDTINSEEVNSAFYIYTNSANQKRIGTIKNLIIDGNYENIHTGLYLRLSSKVSYENINCINVRRGIFYKKGVESFFNNIHMSRDSSLDISGDIDVETTDCVGIECTTTDSHFSNIIIIDFVVGIKMTSGDNRIYGAHVWNYYCKEQYTKSVAFMNGGTNFYTDCVADHFFIGWYVYYATPMYLNGCNITCNAIKDTSKVILPLNSYAFYFGDKNSKNRTGSDIVVTNTRIHGDNNDYSDNVTLSFSNVPDCNINYSGIAENCEKVPVPNMPVMVSGKTVIDDANNSKINQYGGIKSVEKILEFEECSTDFSDIADKTYIKGSWPSNYLYVSSKISVTVSGNSAAILSESGATGYNYLRLYLNDSDGDRPRKLGLKNGDLIMISYKYKTNGSSKVASVENGGLTPYTSYDAVPSLPETKDDAWHNVYRFFTVSDNTSAKISFGDHKPVDLTNALYLTDIRVINLSKYNIPKYYLETDKAYRARLIKLFGTNYTTSVTIPATTDVSFMSVPYKFTCTDVSSESDQMLGFSYLGRPFILTRTSDYKFNYIYTNDNPSSVIFSVDRYTIDQYGQQDISIEVYVDNVKIYTSHNYSYVRNIVVPSGSVLSLRFIFAAGSECKFSRLNINPYNLSMIPIIDATDGYSKIPLYADGEICLVAKNKSGEDLPTAYFEVEYCKPYYTVEEFESLESRIAALESTS